MDQANSGLPQRQVQVDFRGARYPAIVYTARPDVIVRLLRALRDWNPDYCAEVESVAIEDDEQVPPLPLWRLRAWTNR
ncbi:hypothetical protein BJY24_003993 [Nocardia transvalensis]|uniref:Uncharacterized protein n=1 Tax=Nocardia transvalensis TaxID=37333 RepID=A0A7W9PFM7_9NOCA|nr:hypothetical protein [Nocardia transvalensis]MBB5915126.1 hypothetical protein [Nocardia transvalensis]